MSEPKMIPETVFRDTIKDIVEILIHKLDGEACPRKVEEFFELCHPNAVLPERGTDLSAGYDFRSLEDFVVPAGGQFAVDTGIKSHFTRDTVLLLKSRSGLVFKKQIDTVAGVIDADYKDTIRVILSNRGTEDYHGKAGERISQGLFVQLNPMYYPVPEVSKVREGGLGSTGMH